MTRSIWLTIDWRDVDSQVPEAQQEALTQSVFRSLRAHEAVQRVERVPDPDVPGGGMGAQWLWNILTAEIPGGGLREACQEALDQLEGKPVTFKIESGGKTIEAQDVNPQNFDQVVDKLVAAAKAMDE
ncbi:MAG: hypothetical protein WA949_00240 [Phormidesmis sp.]